MAVSRAGFLAFIRTNMGIGQSYLPDSSIWIDYALAVSIAIVLTQISQISPLIYELAVYNLAADNLVNYASDVSVPISSITWASNAATVTTTIPNGFVGGDSIVISGQSPAGYNSLPGQPVTISITGSTTFTYPITPNPGVQTQSGIASEIYFANLRKQFNTYGFVSGIISASADESTSQSLVTPEKMKTLTLANLQNLKTPWGRQYLAFIESYGPIWGLS